MDTTLPRIFCDVGLLCSCLWLVFMIQFTISTIKLSLCKSLGFLGPATWVLKAVSSVFGQWHWWGQRVWGKARGWLCPDTQNLLSCMLYVLMGPLPYTSVRELGKERYIPHSSKHGGLGGRSTYPTPVNDALWLAQFPFSLWISVPVSSTLRHSVGRVSKLFLPLECSHSNPDVKSIPVDGQDLRI